MIKTISNSIEKSIRRRFGDKTRLLALIGSGNTDDFDSLSDLDYLLILDRFSAEDLQFIASIRDNVTKKYKIQIDIKTYTTTEFKASKKYQIGILHAWTQQMILDGKISIIYQNKINVERKKVDKKSRMIIPMSYFIDKLRKYLSIEKVYLRGKVKTPDEKDTFKVLSSCCFCIAKFFLYCQGTMAFSRSEIIGGMKKIKTDYRMLTILDTMRKSKKYRLSNKMKNEILCFAESLYQSVLKDVDK